MNKNKIILTISLIILITISIYILHASKNKYVLEYTEWSSCQQGCGNYIQERTVQCKIDRNDKIVELEKCEKHDILERSCQNYSLCEYIWKVTEWDTCDESCTQKRKLYCKRLSQPTEIVDNSFCDIKLQPLDNQMCNTGRCCPNNQHYRNNRCEDNIRIISCGRPPKNAIWNNDGSIEQTWNGNEFIPHVKQIYSDIDIEGCDYRCMIGYFFQDEKCIKNKN